MKLWDMPPVTCALYCHYMVGCLETDVALLSTDVNPPQVILRSFPNPVSNATQWIFRFYCLDVSGCSFSCSVHELGDPPRRTPCGRSYRVDRLQDGNEYEFEVIATDGVGNVGEPVVYSWKIGE